MTLRLIRVLILLVAVQAFAQSAQRPSSNVTSASFRISGTIVNVVDGQPLADAEVTISPTEQRDDTQQVVTGTNGSFLFDSLSPGKYNLSASHRGFTLQAFEQHDQYSTAIAVGPELVSERLVFPLTPDGSISGLVVDEENEPVRAGEVMLFSRSVGGSGAVRLAARNSLDEQGRYRFGHLRAGTYFVVVSSQPWYAQDSIGNPVAPSSSVDGQTDLNTDNSTSSAQPSSTSPSPLDVVYPITYYPNATEPENAVPIQVRPAEHANADVNLRAVAALHLRIVNASSDPSNPVTVLVEQKIFDTPTQISLRNQQSTNGMVALTGVPPGHLILSVRHFTGKDWVSLDKEVDVSADAEIDPTQDGSSSVAIHGVIHRPDATPFAAGTYIRFSSRETGESFGTQVNDKGEFDLQQAIRASSSYSLAVFNVPNLLVQGISATGAQVAGHTVLFPRGGSVQLSVTLSEGSGRVDGVVLRDGKPVAQTMVLLVPPHPSEDPTLFRRDQSDSDGTFTLRAILPGRYTVIAIERGWDLDWQNPAVLKPYLDSGVVLEVASHRTYKASVTLQPPGAPSASTDSAIQ
jgi:Carboxypeptidase regulatory-like domain